MSAPMKTRRTESAVKVVVGDRNPKRFLVPRKAAEGVIELLHPYVQDAEPSAVPADTVLARQFAKYGKPGTVLRGFRARQDMTQQQLAKALSVTQGDVSAMENGRRPIGKTMAARLAKVFRTDYRVFL